MRTLLLLSLFVASPIVAQPTLTKDETINYINKKLAEVVGGYSNHTAGITPLWLKSASVSLKGSRMTLDYSASNPEVDGYRCSYTTQIPRCWGPSDYTLHTWTATFSPALFTVEGSKVNGTVGYLTLTFPTADVKLTRVSNGWRVTPKTEYRSEHGYFVETTRTSENYRSLGIPFLATDPTNAEKLKKAFLHLQALLKAEDDPFGNE